MRNKLETPGLIRSCLEEYTETISRSLKEIDIYMKSVEGDLDPYVISDLLGISEHEVFGIMQRQNISSITRGNLSNIMSAGSSRLCQTYRRELEIGTPGIYTRENISYIYDIDLRKINEACDELKLKEITWYTLPILLANIPA